MKSILKVTVSVFNNNTMKPGPYYQPLAAWLDWLPLRLRRETWKRFPLAPLQTCCSSVSPCLVFVSFPSDLKSKWHLVVDRLTVLFLKFLEYFHKLQLFIWWLLEIHIIKIVSCYIVLVSLKEVQTPASAWRSVFGFIWRGPALQ